MSTLQIDFGNREASTDRRHRPRHHQQPGGRNGADRPADYLRDGRRQVVPSVVSVATTARSLVGNSARALLITHPERTVYSVKRLMGRGRRRCPGRTEAVPVPHRRRQRVRNQAELGDRTYAARDLRAHSSQAEEERRSGLWARRSHRPSSRFRRISTTRSGRRPRTRAGSRAWKCCGW